MATVISPPPTYADVVLVDPATQAGRFNPIWLKWFLDLSQNINTTQGTVTHTGGALTTNALIQGAGSGDITVLGSLGTTTTLLHGNAAGAPTWAAVSLTADVTGTLPTTKGGTGSATQNFVDLTTTQSSIGGAKTFTDLVTMSLDFAVTGTGNFLQQPGAITGYAASSIFRTNTEASKTSSALYIQHSDLDTTTYSSPNTWQGNGIVITQDGARTAGSFVTGTYTAQYKDMHGLVSQVAQSNANTAWGKVKGVSGFIGLAYQLGYGVATNEFAVYNPAGSAGQAAQMIAVQGEVTASNGSSDGSHFYDVFMASTLGTGQVRAAYNATSSGGGGYYVGLELSNAAYALAAIRLPNNSPIVALNNAGSSNVTIVKVGTNDTVVLGTPATIGSPSIVASVTISTKQVANNYDTITLQRFTDTAPTGYFLRAVDFTNATNLFLVDVSGNVLLRTIDSNGIDMGFSTDSGVTWGKVRFRVAPGP